LDNGATVTSGFQPNPGVGRDALGRPAPALSIERIAAACGVGFVRSVGPGDLGPTLRDRFREAIGHRGLALLVVRTPCDRSGEGGWRPALVGGRPTSQRRDAAEPRGRPAAGWELPGECRGCMGGRAMRPGLAVLLCVSGLLTATRATRGQ